METKKIGVLGGMGPKATSVYYERVISNTEVKKDQDHIDMVILSHASLPDRTEAILNENKNNFLEMIEEDIRLLEAATVSNIALTCNTAHFFYEEIQEMTTVNIINMVDETVEYIAKHFAPRTKVAILATDGTIHSGIYQQACIDRGLNPYTPNSALQSKIKDIIYNDVKANLDLDNSKLEAIINDLITTEKCDCVILACTELSCIELSEQTKKYSVDSLDLLVKRSIEVSGAKIKSDNPR